MTNRILDEADFFFVNVVLFVLVILPLSFSIGFSGHSSILASDFHFLSAYGWTAEFDLCSIFYATAKIINSAYVFISIYFSSSFSGIKFLCVFGIIFKCVTYMLSVVRERFFVVLVAFFAIFCQCSGASCHQAKTIICRKKLRNEHQSVRAWE